MMKETNRRITGRNGRCGYYVLCRCHAGWFYCLSYVQQPVYRCADECLVLQFGQNRV